MCVALGCAFLGSSFLKIVITKIIYVCKGGEEHQLLCTVRFCSFSQLFLKQLQFTVLFLLSVGVFWQRGPILQTCALTRVHTPSFPSKGFIWVLTGKCQRSVGWVACSNLVNSYWKAESEGHVISMINSLSLRILIELLK